MAYTTAQLQAMIIQEARRQGVDPALALGIAQAESSFNPHAVGDNGRSIGLFQLQPAAAIDAGGDPRQRYEVPANIRLGIAYFKNRVAREGGQEDRGIAAYNQGVGLRHGQLSNPQYVSTVRTYQQRFQRHQPTLLARVGRALSPASAEAAPAGRRIDELIRAAGGAPARAPQDAATAPTPEPQEAAPAASTRIDELITAIGGTETPAPTPAPEAKTPSLLERLGMVSTPPPQAAPGAPPSAAPQWRQLLREEEERLTGRASRDMLAGTGLSAGTTAAGARIGGLLGTPFGPVGRAVGTGVGAIAGSYAGRRANVGLELEEPGMFGDVLSIALPAGQAVWSGLKGVAKTLVGQSRGWEAVKQADEATAAGQKAYQEGVETAEQQYAREQAEYQARIRAQEAERLQKVQQRRTVAQEQHAAQEASRQQRVEQRQALAGERAETTTQQHAREYAEQVQRYEQAVASQRQAVPQARAIPGRYTPETPAHVLYKKVADIAPEAPVTLTRTQEVAAELQEVLQQVPSLQPSRLQQLLTDMRAARSTQSVKEVQRYLTDLGTLTRSTDSATRRTAKQLYGALHDDLAESATRLPETEAARELLLQANAAFRREMATRDLAGVVRRAITVGDDGIPRLAPGRLLTQFDRLVEGDRFFAGSFPPDELTTLRSELAGLTTAQKIPTRPGAAPAPVQPRRVEPYTPRPFQEPAIPAGERVVPQTRPAMEGPPETWKPRGPELPPPPEPVPPTLPKRDVGAFRRLLYGTGMLDVMVGPMGPVAQAALGVGAKDQLGDFLAQMIINPRFRPYMQQIVDANGKINLKTLTTLAGGRAALLAWMREEKDKGR